VLLLVAGFWNMIYGIAAIANSHVFVANAHYVFGNQRTWGWITLIFAVLLLIAGGGVMAGNQLARWFGVAVVGLNAIDQMFFIPAYPFWSLTIIAMDVVALYGLCAYGSRENVEAAV
jgi:cytochrome b subunit of formate dehydrogenase